METLGFAEPRLKSSDLDVGNVLLNYYYHKFGLFSKNGSIFLK